MPSCRPIRERGPPWAWPPEPPGLPADRASQSAKPRLPRLCAGAEQEVPAGLGERTQHQTVMLLGDLLASGIEALRVLLESPAQSGLLADGPDHGMKLYDPVPGL